MMSSKASPSHASPPQHKTPKISPTAPGTPNTRQQQQTKAPSDASAVPFPSPQTFDILPPLHALLLRLLSAPSNIPGTGTPSGAQSGTQTLPGESVLPPNADANSAAAAAGASSYGAIDPKALLTGASAVKIRIQKAKNAVEELPDIDRTVDEQEEEIAELERRIERINEVIGDFGQRSERVIDGS